MPSNESHVVASELLRSLQNRISFYFAIEGSISVQYMRENGIDNGGSDPLK